MKYGKVLFFILLISGCSRIDGSYVKKKIELKKVSASAEVVKAKLGTSRDLSPNFMCHNVNSTQVANWHDENFTNAVWKHTIVM